VEVILSPSTAVAVGDHQEAEEVYRIWARARQTRRRPRRLRLADNVGFILIGSLGLAGFSTIVARLLRANLTATLDTFAVIFGLFIVGSGYIWRWQRENALSYALIVPSSLDEYRQSRSNQMYPRRSWIVAIVSAIIAAFAVAAAIWVKLTSK
jgi:hypothetical protein